MPDRFVVKNPDKGWDSRLPMLSGRRHTTIHRRPQRSAPRKS